MRPLNYELTENINDHLDGLGSGCLIPLLIVVDVSWKKKYFSFFLNCKDFDFILFIKGMVELAHLM